MNYGKVGFYVGAIVGLIVFVAAWLLPVSFIAGVSGSKIQQYVSGSSQGLFSVIFMAFIVLASGALITGMMSVIGWVSGIAIEALKSSQPQTEKQEQALANATVGVEEV